MKTKLLLLLAAAMSGTLAVRADPHIGISLRIGAPAPVIVREAPPRRVIEERRMAAPGPGYVWIAGHNTWENGRWMWIQGTWVQPPQPGAVWVEGNWNQQTQNWTEGHWEVAQAAMPGPGGPPPGPGYAYAESPAEEVIANEPPPPPREQGLVERPSRDHIWVAGYWSWEHGKHQWVAGRWELPPHGRTTWVEPRWEHRGNNYVFVRGFWR